MFRHHYDICSGCYGNTHRVLMTKAWTQTAGMKNTDASYSEMLGRVGFMPQPAWLMDLQSGKRSKVRSSLNFCHFQRSEPGLYRKFECQVPVTLIWLKLGLLKLWIFSCQRFTLRHGFAYEESNLPLCPRDSVVHVSYHKRAARLILCG